MSRRIFLLRSACSALTGMALGRAGIARAEDMIPMPAPEPMTTPLAASIPGPLVIAGGGKLPDTIYRHFLELAGGADARIIVVPTASETAKTQNVDFWKHMNPASVKLFHADTRDAANDPQFVHRHLRDATGIWLRGGDQSRLAGAYRGTLVERELLNAWRRGAAIGGTSAGASAMSEVMIPDFDQGFGLLPEAIVDQHFTVRNRLARLLNATRLHGKLGIGIDERTAIVVREREGRRKIATVLGQRNVRVCYPPHCRREVEIFKDGDEIDLSALHLVAAGAADR